LLISTGRDKKSGCQCSGHQEVLPFYSCVLHNLRFNDECILIVSKKNATQFPNGGKYKFCFGLPLPVMGQKKLERFAELNSFSNVLQFPKDIAGKWNDFFKNDHPLTLELACGKGEYAVGLGQLYPQQNFIGVDLKGNRIWVGAKKALQQNLKNVAFLRTQIDKLADYFEKNEVSAIWITFPDPQLRFSKAKKRLTHPKFLRLYQQILIPGGRIHLKTDSPLLYQFTKTVIDLYNCSLHTDYDNVYQQETVPADLQIKTHYESLDIAGSNRIHYLCFSLPESLAGKEKDEELKQVLKAYERAD
jgi:tRNA (guanine-N7-)-methyltransferase